MSFSAKYVFAVIAIFGCVQVSGLANSSLYTSTKQAQEERLFAKAHLEGVYHHVDEKGEVNVLTVWDNKLTVFDAAGKLLFSMSGEFDFKDDYATMTTFYKLKSEVDNEWMTVTFVLRAGNSQYTIRRIDKLISGSRNQVDKVIQKQYLPYRLKFYVGQSAEVTKDVALPMHVVPETAKQAKPIYHDDVFEFTSSGYTLRVERKDQNSGWGQELVIEVNIDSVPKQPTFVQEPVAAQNDVDMLAAMMDQMDIDQVDFFAPGKYVKFIGEPIQNQFTNVRPGMVGVIEKPWDNDEDDLEDIDAVSEASENQLVDVKFAHMDGSMQFNRDELEPVEESDLQKVMVSLRKSPWAEFEQQLPYYIVKVNPEALGRTGMFPDEFYISSKHGDRLVVERIDKYEPWNEPIKVEVTMLTGQVNPILDEEYGDTTCFLEGDVVVSETEPPVFATVTLLEGEQYPLTEDGLSVIPFGQEDVQVWDDGMFPKHYNDHAKYMNTAEDDSEGEDSDMVDKKAPKPWPVFVEGSKYKNGGRTGVVAPGPEGVIYKESDGTLGVWVHDREAKEHVLWSVMKMRPALDTPFDLGKRGFNQIWAGQIEAEIKAIVNAPNTQ